MTRSGIAYDTKLQEKGYTVLVVLPLLFDSSRYATLLAAAQDDQ